MGPSRKPNSNEGDPHPCIDTPEDRQKERISRDIRVAEYASAFFDRGDDGRLVFNRFAVPSDDESAHRIAVDITSFKNDIELDAETPEAVGLSLEDIEALSVYVDMLVNDADVVATD